VLIGEGDSRLSTIEAKIDKVSEQHKSDEKKIRDLNEKVVVQNEEISLLKQQLDDLTKENKKSTDIINQLRSENKDLFAEKTQLSEKIEKLEKRNAQYAKDVVLLRTKVDQLELDKEVQENRTSDLEKQFNQMRNVISKGAKDYNLLQNKTTKLETIDEKLILGQIAFDFQSKVCDRVLSHLKPEERNGLYISSISQLLEYAETDAKANEEWIKIKQKLKYDNFKHKNAIKWLKNLRLDIAHPNSNNLSTEDLKKLAEQYCNKYMVNSKPINEIIDMCNSDILNN